MQKIIASNLFFVAALVLLHALFFFYALNTGNIYLHRDSDEYLLQAENILKYQSWYQGKWDEPHSGYLDCRRPPLTGFLFMVIKQIVNSDFAICFMQCLLGIFNILLVVKIIRLFNPEWKNYAWLLFLLLFFPTQFIYANFIMAEIFFQTLLLLALYFFVQSMMNQGKRNFFVANIFLSLAVLVKPVIFLLWIPLLLFYLWMTFRKKIQPSGLLYLVLFIAAVFFISLRNYKMNGVFQYSSASENYLPDYAVLKSVQFAEGRDAANAAVDSIYSEADKKANYKEYHETIISSSLQKLSEQKTAVALLSANGLINFFLDPGRWDLYAFFDKQPEENMKGWKYYFQQDGLNGAMKYLKQFPVPLIIYLLLAFIINMVIAAAFLVFLFNKSLKPEIRIFMVLVVAYIALMTGMIGSARFRMAVYPFLLAGFFLSMDLMSAYVKKLFQK